MYKYLSFTLLLGLLIAVAIQAPPSAACADPIPAYKVTTEKVFPAIVQDQHVAAKAHVVDQIPAQLAVQQSAQPQTHCADSLPDAPYLARSDVGNYLITGHGLTLKSIKVPMLKAKFICFQVLKTEHGEQASLRPVSTGSEENKSFSKYTPSGNLEMMVTNPDAFGFYQPGQEYYLDIRTA